MPGETNALFLKTLGFLASLAGNFSASEFLAANPQMGLFYLGCAGIAVASDALLQRVGEQKAAAQAEKLVKDQWDRQGTLTKAVATLVADTSLSETISRDRAALLLKVLRASSQELGNLLQENIDLTAHIGRWIELWCTEHDIKFAELINSVDACSNSLKRIETKVDRVAEIDKARQAVEQELELQMRRASELVRGVERAVGIASVLAESNLQVVGLADHLTDLLSKFDRDFGNSGLAPIEDLQIRLAKATAANAQSKFQLSLDLLPEADVLATQQATHLAIANELAVLRTRSYSLYRLRRFREAAAHLQRILVLCGHDVMAMRLLASCLAILGKPRDAIVILDFVINALRPPAMERGKARDELLNALTNRGQVFLNLKQFSDCMKDFDEAVDVARSSVIESEKASRRLVARALYNRGQAQFFNDRLKDAVTDLNTAVAIYRESFDRDDVNQCGELQGLLGLRSKAYRILGNTEEALANACEAIELGEGNRDINNPIAQQQLADCLESYGQTMFGLGRFIEAAESFTRGIEILRHVPASEDGRDSTLANMLRQRGMCYEELIRGPEAFADYDAAVKFLEPLVQTESEHSELTLALALHLRGKMCGMLKRLNEAHDDDTRAIELYRRWPEGISRGPLVMALTTRGITYMLLEQFEHAMADFDAAIANCVPSVEENKEHTAERAYAHLNRGALHARLEHAEQAINDLSAAIDLYQCSSPIAFNRREQAKALLGRANLFGPDRLSAAIKDGSRAIEMYRRLVREGRVDLKEELHSAEGVLKRFKMRRETLKRNRGAVKMLKADELRKTMAGKHLILASDRLLAGKIVEALFLIQEAEWWDPRERKWIEALRAEALWSQAKQTPGPEGDRMFADAYESFDEVLKLDPGMYVAVNDWGCALQHQAARKDPKEAKKLLTVACGKHEAALKINPNEPDALRNWANALISLASYAYGAAACDLLEQAHKKCEAALRLTPDQYDALYDLGRVLAIRAKHGNGADVDALLLQACERFEAASKVGADIHRAINNWGNTLSMRAQRTHGVEADQLFQEAYTKYKTALEAKPNAHIVFCDWGAALLAHAQTKRGEEADKLFEHANEKFEAAVLIKPDLAGALANWGSALAAQAKQKEGVDADMLSNAAYEKFEAAWKLDPEMFELLYNWGSALMGQAKHSVPPEADVLYRKASEKLSGAVEIVPENPHFWFSLSCCYALRHQTIQAVESLQGWRNYDPHPTQKVLDDEEDFNAIRQESMFVEFRASLPE